MAIHRDYGTIAWQRSILAKPAPKLRGVGVRFSAVPAGGVWCLAYRSPVPAGQSHTLGLDPETGEALWRREDLAIHSRSRLASRAGVLVVFTKQEAVALDPKTGATLWVGQGTGPRGTSLYYMQALTDGYIKSKGQDDLAHRARGARIRYTPTVTGFRMTRASVSRPTGWSPNRLRAGKTRSYGNTPSCQMRAQHRQSRINASITPLTRKESSTASRCRTDPRRVLNR